MMIEDWSVLIENVGWFFIGAGFAFVAYGCKDAYKAYRDSRQNIRLDALDALMGGLRNNGPPKAQTMPMDYEQIGHDAREVSEFTYRSADGCFNTVRIIIDPELDDDPAQEEADAMVDGDTGMVETLLRGSKAMEMADVDEFVFSPKAVRDMRAGGLEPDDVVVKMLKASGRMV